MTPRLGSRALFPDLEARAYLNHAAVSPPSLAVRAAVADALAASARLGAGAIERQVEQRGRLRKALAALLGARPDDIAFVAGTSHGLLYVALCLPWKPLDRVVVFEGEFPANVTPWQRAAETFGLELVMLPVDASDAGLARLEAELRRGVRLVASSAVQFQTGLRMPVHEMAALCHAYGAQLAVDAIQAVGVVPFEVGEIDYVAGGAHKWLMGIAGAGYLYIRPDRASALVPRVAGWLSHDDPTGFLVRGAGHLRYDRPIRREAGFLEIGSSNVLGFAALEAAVGIIRSLGVRAIFDHVQRYLDALEAGLVERGFESLRSRLAAQRSGTLSIRVPDAPLMARALGELGIACSSPDGLVRFAPHWPNDLAEVPLVLQAIDRVPTT